MTKNKSGWTPMHLSAQNGHLEVTKFFWKHTTIRIQKAKVVSPHFIMLPGRDISKYANWYLNVVWRKKIPAKLMAKPLNIGLQKIYPTKIQKTMRVVLQLTLLPEMVICLFAREVWLQFLRLAKMVTVGISGIGHSLEICCYKHAPTWFEQAWSRQPWLTQTWS